MSESTIPEPPRTEASGLRLVESLRDGEPDVGAIAPRVRRILRLAVVGDEGEGPRRMVLVE